MLLKLFRSIFGCYSNSDIQPIVIEKEIEDSCLDKDKIIGFISYDEEAMANVTNGKYKYIWFRNKN